MSKTYISAELRRLVTQRSQNCCEYCWIPENDRWENHFQFQQGEIIPVTAIGRVTVRLLQLNRSERVTVRRILEESDAWDIKQR